MNDFEPGEEWSPTADGSKRLDDRLALLADHDRRVLVSTLIAGETDRVQVAQLVEALSREHADGRSPEQIQLRLHHRHLPRLQKAGVLTYDDDSAEVLYHGDALLEACLSSVSGLASD